MEEAQQQTVSEGPTPSAANHPDGPCIMHVCTNFRSGGIQRHVLDLTAWLRRNGYRVRHAGAPAEWMNSSLDTGFVELPLNRVSADPITQPRLPERLRNLLTCSLTLRSVLRQGGVDLLHAHETAPALVARLASVGMKIPIVYTYHGSVPERVPEVGLVARMTADCVITPSHTTAKALHERGRVPERRLRVIGLGIEQAASVDEQRVDALRDELLGAEGRRLVVMVARLSAQKGIDIFIRAVREIVAVDPSIRFAVVGGGPLEQEARAWAEQAGVNSYVRFIGHSGEPHVYMRAGDLFLLTSRWEALPITIAEAFRQGLPVIATDCGGVKELVDEHVGRVVPVGDEPAIVKAVLDICRDDTLREGMSARARERSREDRFSPAWVNQRFHETYTELIARAHGGAKRAR